MDDLEAIKRKKLAELQAKQEQALRQQIYEQQKIQEQVEQVEALIKQYFTKEALQRYGNLRIAHAEKAMKVLAIFAQMIQKGQLRQKVTDMQFKEILRKIEPRKQDFRITRK